MNSELETLSIAEIINAALSTSNEKVTLYLLRGFVIPESFIRNLITPLNRNTWSTQVQREKIVRGLTDNVFWREISSFQKLSEDFIREFQNKVEWSDISWHQDLSEGFIREFQDKVDWMGISCKQKLSEDFIREFQNKINWSKVSAFQALSENFIREFQDKVDWELIASSQPHLSGVTQGFLLEFIDKIKETKFDINRVYSVNYIPESYE